MKKMAMKCDGVSFSLTLLNTFDCIRALKGFKDAPIVKREGWGRLIVNHAFDTKRRSHKVG